MGKRSGKKGKKKRTPEAGASGKSKRYSAAEIFMAVLGAALIILFGVLTLLVIFE
jgi:hypothetical protein